MSLFSFITDINGFFEYPTPSPRLFRPPPRLLNLTKYFVKLKVYVNNITNLHREVGSSFPHYLPNQYANWD